MFPDQSGDAMPVFGRRFEALRIGAEGVSHLFERQRVQNRGVPAMRALRELGDWQPAELVRKKIEASMAGFVFGADEDRECMAPVVQDADGNRIEQFEPDLIGYVRNGKDIKFNTPASTSGTRADVPAPSPNHTRTTTPETQAPETEAPAETRAAPVTTPAADPPPDAISTEANRAAAEVLALCERHTLGAGFAADLIRRGLSLDATRAAILDKLVEIDAPGVRNPSPQRHAARARTMPPIATPCRRLSSTATTPAGPS